MSKFTRSKNGAGITNETKKPKQTPIKTKKEKSKPKFGDANTLLREAGINLDDETSFDAVTIAGESALQNAKAGLDDGAAMGVPFADASALIKNIGEMNLDGSNKSSNQDNTNNTEDNTDEDTSKQPPPKDSDLDPIIQDDILDIQQSPNDVNSSDDTESSDFFPDPDKLEETPNKLKQYRRKERLAEYPKVEFKVKKELSPLQNILELLSILKEQKIIHSYSKFGSKRPLEVYGYPFVPTSPGGVGRKARSEDRKPQRLLRDPRNTDFVPSKKLKLTTTTKLENNKEEVPEITPDKTQPSIPETTKPSGSKTPTSAEMELTQKIKPSSTKQSLKESKLIKKGSRKQQEDTSDETSPNHKHFPLINALGIKIILKTDKVCKNCPEKTRSSLQVWKSHIKKQHPKFMTSNLLVF